ncbi:MAG: hydrogenase maturation nickel metallochaperone HypA [Bacteroidales bacterium]
MHEIAIAEDLARIVLDTAREGGLSEVSAINVSFGQMVAIVPDIFRFAFGEAVRETIAGNAKVNIEILPVKLKCMNCGEVAGLEENYFTCGNCGSNELEILQGKEMFIKSIEGE